MIWIIELINDSWTARIFTNLLILVDLDGKLVGDAGLDVHDLGGRRLVNLIPGHTPVHGGEIIDRGALEV